MEQIKFIISKLNQPPFSKNLNLISYDNLSGEQRIQILFETFKAIDNTVSNPVTNFLSYTLIPNSNLKFPHATSAESNRTLLLFDVLKNFRHKN